MLTTCLPQKPETRTRPIQKQQVLNQLCRMEDAEFGLLFPSGMSAISSVVSLLRRPEKPKVIVIGLLYTDTYGFLESPFRRKKRHDLLY